jgi:uncharacterized protein (TIGR03067 family)
MGRGPVEVTQEDCCMKSIAAFALGLGLLALLGSTARTDDKKPEAPKLEGKYTLVGGKKNDKPIDDDAKKGEFTFTADKVTIKGMGMTFVMGYKLDAKQTPIHIDMEILEGIEGSKGTKAAGIIEVKGDTLKLAYSLDKDKDDKFKRPTNFDGKDGMFFEFKKAK